VIELLLAGGLARATLNASSQGSHGQKPDDAVATSIQ